MKPSELIKELQELYGNRLDDVRIQSITVRHGGMLDIQDTTRSSPAKHMVTTTFMPPNPTWHKVV